MKTLLFFRKYWSLGAFLALIAMHTAVWAAPQEKAEPYHVELTTIPAVIPVGRVQLLLKITTHGQPVIGATVKALVQMPGMPIGERNELAAPQIGKPGVYAAPARFAMAGSYNATIHITGPQGGAKIVIPIYTGQTTNAPAAKTSGPAVAPSRSAPTPMRPIAVAPPPPVDVSAGLQGQSGPYNVELTTIPAVIPVGRVQLLLKITTHGQPVIGATVKALVQMPGMPIGERNELAAPQIGKPGVYAAPAQFAMAGSYNATIHIAGPQGGANIVIPISTGQNTAITASSSIAATLSNPAIFMPWLIGLALLGFVFYRMRHTGQRITWSNLLRPAVWGSVFLIALLVWLSFYVVNHYRTRNAMTPVAAMAMQMTMPPPPGSSPVTLATVQRGSLSETVSYTGQAVGYVQQTVTPRITGLLVWMPFYAGDKVRRGQILARLDTSQTAPQVAEQQAALNMAQSGAASSQAGYRQAQAMVKEAEGEHGAKLGAVEEANANTGAARQAEAAAQAQLVAAHSDTAAAQAMLLSAKADNHYWQLELQRERKLLKAGAVSPEEFQLEESQAANAAAKQTQTQAQTHAAQAQERAAHAQVQQAAAAITSAQARVTEETALMNSHNAHVAAEQAAVQAAQEQTLQAQAGVRQAQAGLASATAQQSYTEIRAESDGVVTQRIISPGVLVQPGQTILTVAQIRPIRLQANVAENDLKRIHVGSPVRIEGADSSAPPLLARITSVAPFIDPVAHTGIVEAIAPNTDSRFLPGQYVNMSITVGRGANILTVPTRAIEYPIASSPGILSTRVQPYIWAADPVPGEGGQYTVHAVKVQVGLSDGVRTEIRSGLLAGQQVVVAGQEYLKDGDAVHSVIENSAPPFGAASDASPATSGAVQGMSGMAGMSGMGEGQ